MKQSDWLRKLIGPFTPDAGLLFARVTGALLVLHVHGLPKLLHFSDELAHIDDPLHMGRALTLYCALFAELVCPVLVAVGLLTRLASLPFLFLLLVSMLPRAPGLEHRRRPVRLAADHRLRHHRRQRRGQVFGRRRI